VTARLDPEFEMFVRASSTRLLRSAVLLVAGDRAAAEDLVQSTLMRVSRHWPAARPAPEPYARQVLVNLSRDRHRRLGRRVGEAPLESVVAVPLDGDHADLVVGRDAMIAALAALPARQREVLVLRFYADLSVAETAAATGASEGTVKSYTSRALAHLRELLADPVPDEVSHDHR
jgi:RNA polymerase sigma-70 factor (sigma-E family)